ncbi:MAG: hypothetical protein IJF70_00660 [Opitutales bacterium]|nr:hypothetical protein [Opitutales bacterium]
MQVFIPLPMTMGCAMYCAETLPDGTPIKVNKGLAERRTQKEMLVGKKQNKFGAKKFGHKKWTKR